MIEILIAIILQITTIVTGADSDKVKEEQKIAETKAKTEQQNSTADGGQGNWE
ncbi:hypothetical protein [Pontibacter pudoricolor]|uniref:hypothetical protein n=1 Tax=Pontibacter pudoricolor TaxID=2694930 RepID=UPI001390DA14|nr:hypothetical protein [Pontibacter pudoricolor]